MVKTDKEFLAHLRCAEKWMAFRIRDLIKIVVNSKYEMLLLFKDGFSFYAVAEISTTLNMLMIMRVINMR